MGIRVGGTFGLRFLFLFGGDARGAEAGEIGDLVWASGRSGCAVAWRFCAGLFQDGFADAPAEVAIGVLGVTIEDGEIVERGEGLGAGAGAEDVLAETFDVREAAEDFRCFVGFQDVEYFAHSELVVLGNVLG